MKKVKFIPAEQRLLVLPDDKQEVRTSSGIIIPGKTQEDYPYLGTIIEVGSGNKDNPMLYKVGDMVLFSSYAGVETNLDYIGMGMKVFKVMNQLDVMGKIVEVE